jgi:uncharacterized protein YjbI with pentapeptide repeats
VNLSGADVFYLAARALADASTGGALELAQTELRDTQLSYRDVLDLSALHLEGAYLNDAHLERAVLPNARLKGAGLRGAHLEGTALVGAHLEGAGLCGAHLEGKHVDAYDLARLRPLFNDFWGNEFPEDLPPQTCARPS